MIDRTYLKRAAPMTEWPDWDSAPLRALCAPLSAGLDSPRGNPCAGAGYVMSPKARVAKVARARATQKKRVHGTRGKYE